MKIAFYAPLKSPHHPNPSGDRRMARLIIKALEQAGHEVTLISEFRSFCKQGEGETQERLWAEGEAERARIQKGDYRPDIWFTYHLHYKAPDHLGPALSRHWNIPYLIAEASHAPKRATGEWARNHASITQALEQATRVLFMTQVDRECLENLLGKSKLVHFPPFIDEGEFAGVGPGSGPGLRGGFGLPDIPVLLSVGMMRPGDKMESYRTLATVLERIREKAPDLNWLQWIVGDGEGRDEVVKLFAAFEDRVRFEGEMPEWALPPIYASSDIYVWPAIREAYGVAFMEAQLCGLPVVAGDPLGVPDVVSHGSSGFLSPEGDVVAMADHLIDLLTDASKRLTMGTQAERYIRENHTMAAATKQLDHIIKQVVS